MNDDTLSQERYDLAEIKGYVEAALEEPYEHDAQTIVFAKAIKQFLLDPEVVLLGRKLTPIGGFIGEGYVHGGGFAGSCTGPSLWGAMDSVFESAMGYAPDEGEDAS